MDMFDLVNENCKSFSFQGSSRSKSSKRASKKHVADTSHIDPDALQQQETVSGVMMCFVK